MEIDELEQQLLSQFRSLATSDRDVLITQFQKLKFFELLIRSHMFVSYRAVFIYYTVTNFHFCMFIYRNQSFLNQYFVLIPNLKSNLVHRRPI